MSYDLSTVIDADVKAGAVDDPPLLVLPDNRTINLADGYIPLLTSFTHEDKAAKGLRKRGPLDAPEPPIYFTALEVARDHRLLLLVGPTGSGKTTFAKWLCQRLATNEARIEDVVRNDLGDVRQERWEVKGVRPYYITINSSKSLDQVIEVQVPQILASTSPAGKDEGGRPLIVLDAVERAGPAAPSQIEEVVKLISGYPFARLLVLCELDACSSWAFAPTLARHTLLPLLQVQRRLVVSRLLKLKPAEVEIGIEEAAENAAVFAMTLQAGIPGYHAEDVVDDWLALTTPTASQAERLEEYAFEAIKSMDYNTEQASYLSTPSVSSVPLLAHSTKVQQLLAARYLTRLPSKTAVDLFFQAPATWEHTTRSLIRRLKGSPTAHNIVDALLSGQSQNAQRGALLVSSLQNTTSKLHRDRIAQLMLEIISQARLSLYSRVEAGQVLSRLGDPRDLEALAHIPAGDFSMGSNTHPNSQPIHSVFVGAFQIGRYPVVNEHYWRFIQDTNRPWCSPNAEAPEKRNTPATDLTWHDANAYCTWLTTQWRESGRIGQDDCVRLPTEAEWERAARGDQLELSSSQPTYPWKSAWANNAANSDESGLNAPCTVGLFPGFMSQYGCLDMGGQVWEWCSTLWGEDMGTPSFKYPYRRDDGREATEASPVIRRVLRGGCFSSGALKANCSYRGSLEPAGYWRGNGFRIVVSKCR